MSTKSKKKSWIVLNMDDGGWYWVEDQPDEKAAIEEYLRELFPDDNTYSMTLQIYPVPKYSKFKVEKKLVSKPVFSIKKVN